MLEVTGYDLDAAVQSAQAVTGVSVLAGGAAAGVFKLPLLPLRRYPWR